jgi:hypothetical protein
MRRPMIALSSEPILPAFPLAAVSASSPDFAAVSEFDMVSQALYANKLPGAVHGASQSAC